MTIVFTILASIYIFFLPGFAISLVFFTWKRLDIIERLTFSFGLSITIVPLVIFYCNLLGIPITMGTVILQVTGILALAGIILPLQHAQITK